MLLAIACAIAVLSQAPQQPAPESAPRPNFVVVLADDQGWTGTSVPMDPRRERSSSDFYRTPALERLAAGGMTFSNAYAAAPNCSPSRAALQTGKSPARIGMTDIIGAQPGSGRYRTFYEGHPLAPPVPVAGLDEEHTTVAELLKTAGYVTAHFGKWHLAGGGPTRHGYDFTDGARGSEGRQSEDDPKNVFGVTASACAFIKEHAKGDRPFFVQVSHFAVHLPIRARPETIAKYEELSPGEHHRHPAHAAMTEELDTALGRLLDCIDEAGVAAHTWILYTSDNGAYVHNGVTDNLPLRGGKASVFEGGIRVPMVVRGPGVAPGSHSHVPVIGWDLLPTLHDLASVEAALPRDLDGGSLRAVLLDEGRGAVDRPGDALYWHFPHYQTQKGTTPQSALRLGDEKLILTYEDEAVRLFDLARDIGEHRDLAEEHSARADALRTMLAERLREAGAPMPRRAAEAAPQDGHPNER